MINMHTFYFLFVSILSLTVIFVFISLFFFTAPYGRHAKKGIGPLVPARLGWVLMELPAVLCFFYFFLNAKCGVVAYLFLTLWQMHYINRTFIFPFLLKHPKPMPILIPIMGATFNFMNAYINGYSVTLLHSYQLSWLYDPRFIIGSILFASGFLINLQSDQILRHLRKPNETEYKIPQGGLFRWITCPNYFGEIIEWLGWAIATWSLAGLLFAIWTIANLLPRALSHHRWYLEKFPDYPKNRRALFFAGRETEKQGTNVNHLLSIENKETETNSNRVC